MRSARRAVGGMVQENGSRERCMSWTVLHAQCTSALSSEFPILQGNAEALERWGGKTKHLLISYFLSNISAKNYRNRIAYVKTIASQSGTFFETQCTHAPSSDHASSSMTIRFQAGNSDGLQRPSVSFSYCGVFQMEFFVLLCSSWRCQLTQRVARSLCDSRASCFNVQVAFTMVDELCDFSPKLVQDDFFNVVDVDIAYNQSSVEYRDRHYQGSADVHRSRGFHCCGSRSVFNFDPLFHKVIA